MRMADYAVGLHHVGIQTEILPETMLFYTDLGFEPVFTGTMPDSENTVVYMKLGNLLLELLENDSRSTVSGENEGPEASVSSGAGAIGHFAIEVNNIEEAFDFVCSRGLNNLEAEICFLPFPGKGTRYFTVEGPNRELIRFMEMHGHSFKTVKDPAVIEEAKRIGDTMPAWPAQGSIAEQDGYILIHIED